MRNAMVTILTLSAASVAALSGASPAAAHDYPYCLQGRGVGVPGDCAYTSYEQCMVAASGRALSCNINPRVAYGERPRRGRVYDPYRAY